MDKNNEGDRLLPRAEVERRVGLGRSAIYRMMRAGEFPAPLQIGPKTVRWRESEIAAWVDGLPRSHGDGVYRAAGKRTDADSQTAAA